MNTIKNLKKMALSPELRLEKILELISSRGFGGVSELSKMLNVSEMTIRRDMEKLEAEGHIRRTHGGALTEAKSQYELDFKLRKKRFADEKKNIGQIAAKQVKQGQCVFIDAGTTTLAMAEYLKLSGNMTVVTNSLPLYSELLDCKNLEVILIGGKILTSTMSLVGTLAQENLTVMRFDWAFLGTGGIDLERGLTHSTMEEIPIKKAAAESAQKVAVLVDNSKFGYNALSLFMPLDKIDVIVTNKSVEITKNHPKILWDSNLVLKY